MSSCPACGNERLKSAPLPVMSLAVPILTGKRRYQCTSCSWTGWRRRLRRGQRPLVTLTERRLTTPRTVGFFVIVLLVLAAALAALLLQVAESSEPRPLEGTWPPGRTRNQQSLVNVPHCWEDFSCALSLFSW